MEKQHKYCTRDIADLIPYVNNSRTHSEEQTGRNAHLMELDEKYVDVIIKRWQEFTGKKAVHIETGKTYEELKGERHG